MAWLLVFPCAFLFNLLRSCNHMDLKARELAKTLSKPALSCGLMYAVVAFVRQIFPWSGGVSNLIVLIIAGAIAYITFTFIFNRQGIEEVRGLLKYKAS
ncbi:MAG: polysaccharide biosynthesis C-terminal domain-containing protein [Betaproteobacteria bacterium]|nr:polysaccharide biosynthesis C-terminal domain-containing protein [Betaproteobacteria bacterium]